MASVNIGDSYCSFDIIRFEWRKSKVERSQRILSDSLSIDGDIVQQIVWHNNEFRLITKNPVSGVRVWVVMTEQRELAISAFELTLKIDPKTLEAAREGLFDKLRKSKESEVLP